ncbi:MAG: acetolactate synthase large subunit, partial [Rhodospirillaceae bacterium]|nr:acetolactate synthase large subunit [Rhodospirillaceae bacterium]
ICGDGGFMMNCQEMETAVRLGLNLVIMVLRDDAYGMIRWKQNAHGLKPYSLQFGNPDFVTFAESFGAKGHCLAATDDLVPLLDACFDAKGVHLVEVPVDYSENEKVLTDELRQKTGLL